MFLLHSVTQNLKAIGALSPLHWIQLQKTGRWMKWKGTGKGVYWLGKGFYWLGKGFYWLRNGLWALPSMHLPDLMRAFQTHCIPLLTSPFQIKSGEGRRCSQFIRIPGMKLGILYLFSRRFFFFTNTGDCGFCKVTHSVTDLVTFLLDFSTTVPLHAQVGLCISQQNDVWQRSPFNSSLCWTKKTVQPS